MKQHFLPVFAVSFLLMLSACINIQYDGVSEAPVPDAEKIELYFSGEQIPVKDYRVLGEATATAGSSADRGCEADCRRNGASGPDQKSEHNQLGGG